MPIIPAPAIRRKRRRREEFSLTILQVIRDRKSNGEICVPYRHT
jgi:hypothetical protein